MIRSCFILDPSDYEVLVSIFTDVSELAERLHESDEKEFILDKVELGKFVLGVDA